MTPEQNPATENNRTAEAIMRFPWTHGVLVCKPENGRGTEKRRIRLRKIRAVRNACGGKTCAAQEFSVQTEEITGRKAMHRNYRPQEFTRLLEETLIPVCAAGEFFAGGEILSLKKNRRGRVTLLKNRNRQTDAEERRGTEEHNREKKRILSAERPAPFLTDLGILTADGKPAAPMTRKYKQINRFLEFIRDLLPAIRRTAEKNGIFRIVDFGCGKSYLTFAVHHFLRNGCGIPADVTGVDQKQDVMETCAALAEKYGCTDSLHFRYGSIEDFPADAHPDTAPDMVIALHACDTATDAALAKAVRSGCGIILSVPCCQHEADAQLTANLSAGTVPPQLMPLLRHGLLRERAASLFTDSLRAEFLCACGYQVQMLEFTGLEHTAKNILIRAVKHPHSGNTPDIKKQKAYQSYILMRDFLHLSPALERLLPDRKTKGRDG